MNLQALREKLAAGRGPAFWRTLEEAAETEDLREYVEQEFPGLSGQIPQGCGSTKPAEGDGGIACDGGRCRLYEAAEGIDRSVCTATGECDSRRSAVLRDRDADRRLCARFTGRKPPEPAYQGRRKSGSSGQPGCDEHFRTSIGSEPVRPGPV